MPLYEYECEACGHRFEVIQKYSDPHVSVCPKCGSGPVQKLFSSPAIQFKGSGFYITDYARAGQGEDGKSKKDGANLKGEAKGEKGEGAKSEGGKSEGGKGEGGKSEGSSAKDGKSESSSSSDKPASSSSDSSSSSSGTTTPSSTPSKSD